MGKPKEVISVITVVYNGVENIETTIISVLSQTYTAIEYILIDGGSIDGTVDIIKKYSDKIAYWVSEKDNGLYYAMNKGIEKASGEWIIFMNCADYFYDNEVVSSIFSNNISHDISAIIGGAYVRSYWTNFYINARKDSEVWKSFVHQSLFTRRELNLKYKFDSDFKYASDFNFVYTIFSCGYKFLSIGIVISSILYASDGFTSRNEILNKRETLKSIKLHSNSWYSFLHHYTFHLVAYFRKCLAVLVYKVSPGFIIFLRRIRDREKND